MAERDTGFWIGLPLATGKTVVILPRYSQTQPNA